MWPLVRILWPRVTSNIYAFNVYMLLLYIIRKDVWNVGKRKINKFLKTAWTAWLKERKGRLFI